MNIDREYYLLPTLDKKSFDKCSFVNWSPRTHHHQIAFLEDVQTVEQALERLLKKFPNLRIIRGTDYTKLLGTQGDFFLGNLKDATHYSYINHLQERREFPTLVSAGLRDLLSSYPHIINNYNGAERHIIQSGTIKINLSDDTLPNFPESLFTLHKPPTYDEFGKFSYGSFTPSISDRVFALMRIRN